jgi:hypothetical protein
VPSSAAAEAVPGLARTHEPIGGDPVRPDVGAGTPGLSAAVAVEVLADARAAEAVARDRRPWLRGWRVYAALALITLFGGALRFANLDSPAIWGDEAATYSRVCGTYQQMLDALRTAGFGPLHYELYWWIRQGMPVLGQPLVSGGIVLTPFWLRVVPALAGTLMVPAMFFLTTQLAGKRTALLVALMTACSAYLLNYSRDAKMYSHFWLCGTMYLACLLWWLRARTWTSWLSWVLFGSLMLGLQLVGSVFVAVGLVATLLAPGSHLLLLPRLLVATLFAPLLPLLGVFDRIDRWAHRPRLAFGFMPSWVLWLAAQLRKAPLHAVGSRGPAGRAARWVATPLRFPAIVPFLIGTLVVVSGPYGYTQYFNAFDDRVFEADGQIDLARAGIPWVEWYNSGRRGQDLVTFTVSAWLTSWEWPRLDSQVKEVDPRTLALLQTTTCALLVSLGLGLLPWRAAWRRVRGAPPAKPPPAEAGRAWPRLVVWPLFAFWLIVPTYGWYAQSIRGATPPTDIVLQALFVNPQPVAWPRWPGGVNDPRFDEYKRPTGEDRWKFVEAAGTALAETWRAAAAATPRWGVVGAMALLATIGLWVGFATWRARLTAAGVVAGTVVVLLVATTATRAVIYNSNGSVWMPRYVAVMLPAFLILSAELIRRLPTRPVRYAVVALFVVANLAQYQHRVWGYTEPPSRELAVDLVRGVKDPSFRAFANIAGGPEPGRGMLNTMALRYYLVTLSGESRVDPAEFRLAPFLVDNRYVRYRPDSRGFVVQSLRRSPEVTRAVVWDRLSPGQTDPLIDRLGKDLGEEWSLVSTQVQPVRDHWTHRELFVTRRREYARKPPEPPAPAEPASQPTTAPSR